MSVYTQLIADVHANLPTLHRYLKLRQRMMGLPALGYEDLYAPIVEKVDLQYTPEQAMALTLEAVAPLGPDYVEALRKGFAVALGGLHADHRQALRRLQQHGATACIRTSCRTSTAPTTTSRRWRTSPGHSMHSYLSTASQPYATSRLLDLRRRGGLDAQREPAVPPRARPDAGRPTRGSSCSASYLDTLRTTLFRQTLFAEFELRIHEMVERGEPLTGETLSKLYLELLRQYYGHEQGVVQVDEPYGVEWALHPALLPQLLRLPVRHQHDRRHDARGEHHRRARR